MSDASGASGLLDSLEFFQDTLFKIAEYKLPPAARYAKLRAELLVVTGLASTLPRYLREFETPEEVWGYVKGFDKTWEGRRTRISEGLQPAFDWVRQGIAQSVHVHGGFSDRVTGLVTLPPTPGGERKVVVFGPDQEAGLARLREIQRALSSVGQSSHLIRELPDIPDQSLAQKVRLWSLAGPFAVMEDSIAGGHLVEYEYCKQMGVTLLVLRETGKGSTWMINESDSLTFPFIRFMSYDAHQLGEVVAEGVQWARELSETRAKEYREKEPWRKTAP